VPKSINLKVALKLKQTTNKEQTMDFILNKSTSYADEILPSSRGWLTIMLPPESLKAVQDEIKNLREANKKLKEKRFVYDKDVWSPTELHRILDNYELNWNGVCREVEKLKEENKELQHDAELTKEFWTCLMDCRDSPDDPSKDEIDEWCDTYDKSDEIRYHIYSECGIEEESSEEEEEEEVDTATVKEKMKKAIIVVCN